jgi:hypothetical protein
MKNKVFLSMAIIVLQNNHLLAQTGNNVFTGAEAGNLGIVNLATPGGQTWSTFRGATPGYFSSINTATYTGASDAANINGYIKKYGNQAFTFVTGTGTDLRTLSISAPAASTDAYATAWIAGDPSGATDPTAPNAGAHSINSLSSPIKAISMAGQWDWQVGNGGNLGTGTTGTGAGLTITVSIPDMSSFALSNDLRLAGWNGTTWIDLSGAATASGNLENSTLSGTMVAGITAIGIGSAAYLLPLSLVDFNAKKQDCAVTLSWETVNEPNTQSYEIQQSRGNAVFTTIGHTTAQNTPTAGVHYYDFTAVQMQEIGYYRLKIPGTDGSYTYSPVIAARTTCHDKNHFRLYPNFITAGNSIVTLDFSLAYTGSAFIVITNPAGQVIQKKPIVINNGANTIQLSTAELPGPGTWFVELTDTKGGRMAAAEKIVRQ